MEEHQVCDRLRHLLSNFHQRSWMLGSIPLGIYVGYLQDFQFLLIQCDEMLSKRIISGELSHRTVELLKVFHQGLAREQIQRRRTLAVLFHQLRNSLVFWLLHDQHTVSGLLLIDKIQLIGRDPVNNQCLNVVLHLQIRCFVLGIKFGIPQRAHGVAALNRWHYLWYRRICLEASEAIRQRAFLIPRVRNCDLNYPSFRVLGNDVFRVYALILYL